MASNHFLKSICQYTKNIADKTTLKKIHKRVHFDFIKTSFYLKYLQENNNNKKTF